MDDGGKKQKEKMTYLLLRLTSLGNVAMMVPIVESLSRRYKDDRFVVVAQKPLSSMFYGMDNVVYHEVTLREQGLSGLRTLFDELRMYKADAVIDLQDVFRTRLLRMMFRLRGVKTYHMCPYGAGTEFDRYRKALQAAGLKTDEAFESLKVNEAARERVIARLGEPKEGEQWVGIAPFAKSKSNMLPYAVTKELIQHYSRQPGVRVFLFGAGNIECEMLRQWASIFPNVVSVAGQLPLEEELELMRRLKVMICMDSANQHLSSLVGLRAVSIWCGTHVKNGFYGWKQNPQDRVERELACRPCTKHGTNQCCRHSFACREINAESIISKI